MPFNWEDIVKRSDAAIYAPIAAEEIIARTREALAEEGEKDSSKTCSASEN